MIDVSATAVLYSTDGTAINGDGMFTYNAGSQTLTVSNIDASGTLTLGNTLATEVDIGTGNAIGVYTHDLYVANNLQPKYIVDHAASQGTTGQYLSTTGTGEGQGLLWVSAPTPGIDVSATSVLYSTDGTAINGDGMFTYDAGGHTLTVQNIVAQYALTLDSAAPFNVAGSGGAAGQVLTSDGTYPSWQTPASPPPPIIQAATTNTLTPANAYTTFILTSGTEQDFATSGTLGSGDAGLVWYVKNAQPSGGAGNDVSVSNNGTAITGATNVLYQRTPTNNTASQILYWTGTDLIMY